MASIFSKIATAEIPCYKVAENDLFFAFLDSSPLTKGHTLVIPKQEVDYLFSIEDSILSQMILFAKNVALAIEQVIPCTRIGLLVVGLEVAHAHIHLIPIHAEGDMLLSNPRLQLEACEMEEIAQKIRNQLSINSLQ